jgi:hypothetical protein
MLVNRRSYRPAADDERALPSSDAGVMHRRDFIRIGASGLAGGAVVAGRCSKTPESQNVGRLGDLRSATPSDLEGLVGNGRRRRILLRGGAGSTRRLETSKRRTY